MEEDFRVKYIRSLNNVLNLDKEIDKEDRANLNGCIGSLFHQILMAGNMTKDLAIELDCECMWPRRN